MSKYDALERHLRTLSGATWHATFQEVERILGFALPPSARSHQAWWANSHDHMPQHRSWLDAGWRTSNLNITAGHVSFERAGIEVPAAAPKPAQTIPIQHTWDSTERKLMLGLGLSWRPLGRLATDSAGRLLLPDAPAKPGIYCFRVLRETTERRYVGEAISLARRFRNYRTPSSSQSTAIRVNALLTEALRNGAEASASAVIDGAWLDWGNGPLKANLSSQAIRRLFENAALVEAHAVDIETLNRGAEPSRDE